MKRRLSIPACAALAALTLAGCGVPREAASLAHAAAAASQPADAADPAVIRTALLAQRQQWNQLEMLVYEQEFLGVWGVDDRFRTLVSRTAALARRQAQLIEQQQDDPAQNAAAIRALETLWRDADRYLNP
jgi:hypothetical protein